MSERQARTGQKNERNRTSPDEWWLTTLLDCVEEERDVRSDDAAVDQQYHLLYLSLSPPLSDPCALIAVSSKDVFFLLSLSACVAPVPLSLRLRPLFFLSLIQLITMLSFLSLTPFH